MLYQLSYFRIIVGLNLKTGEWIKSISIVQPEIAYLIHPSHRSTQEEILRCTLPSTPPHFREFIQNLGDCVDMEHHYGYDGALEHSPNMNSIYYCDENFEIMFHVGPIMKTHKDDPQQVYKKRHIGNDNVHIIWNENTDVDYNTSTIVSQFNDAHVIITPRKTKDMYEVHLKKKEASYETGPIYGKLFLNKKSLGVLARWSAVLSDLSIRKMSSPLETPHDKFFKHIRQITI